MHPLAPGTDRWGTEVVADREGAWTFTVEAWGDPVATWRHDAPIKIAAGVDVELMLEEGARIMARAAALDRPEAARACAHRRRQRAARHHPPGRRPAGRRTGPRGGPGAGGGAAAGAAHRQ